MGYKAGKPILWNGYLELGIQDSRPARNTVSAYGNRPGEVL
jgi:hypothetical protein